MGPGAETISFTITVAIQIYCCTENMECVSSSGLIKGMQLAGSSRARVHQMDTTPSKGGGIHIPASGHMQQMLS